MSGPDYRQIYATRAADYDALIAAEDAAGEVARFLASVIGGHSRIADPAENLSKIEISTALDVGAGTGRLARHLQRLCPTAELTCTDASAAMLDELVRRWPFAMPAPNCVTADYRALPFPDDSFDLVMAGWALGHLTGFHPASYLDEAALALAELERVARPDANLVIFETLGTGRDEPAPPRVELAELYAAFEARGFTRTVLRTDYRFASREEATRLTSFFFGERVVAALRERGDHLALIEWTGAWHRRLPG